MYRMSSEYSPDSTGIGGWLENSNNNNAIVKIPSEIIS